MAKKLLTTIKLQVTGGQANPAPPIGPALGQHGVNIMDFCKRFNEQTKDKQGTIIPVVISVYQDKSISFIMKSPPVASLLKKAAGLAKASSNPKVEKIGKVTKSQVQDIAKEKMQDLNADTVDAAMRMIAGTARSMGIEIVE
jgi:large subunit ribosomal protein L11